MDYVIDWKSMRGPWNVLGPEMAEHVKRVARGEADDLCGYRCELCQHLFDTPHGLRIHLAKAHSPRAAKYLALLKVSGKTFA